MKNYFHSSRLDREPGLRHGVVRANNGDRNDGNSALHRKIERAFFEGEELAVEGALAFNVNGHVESLIDDQLGGAHGFDAGVAIATIDGDERSHAHGAAEDWDFEQFFLHHHRSALGNQRDLNWRVEVRDVIGHEDVAARVVELVESDRFDAHAGDPYAGPSTPHEEAIQDAHVTHDEGCGESDDRR